MLILQLPPRIVKYDGKLTFPLPVEVHVELTPKAVFGEEPLDGRLPIGALGGGQVQFEADRFHGGIRFKHTGRLGRLNVEAPLFHAQVVIDGATAVLAVPRATENDFRATITLAEVHLPAFLSAVVHAPVVATDVYGLVGSTSFQVEFAGSCDFGFFADNAERIAARIVDYFAKLSQLPNGSERIWSAHRYLQQARKLRIVSTYPGEFLGERIVNLYKVLESIFASRTVDQIRSQLHGLAVPKDAAEFLCSIVFVRDQLDGGHMALHALSSDEYAAVHSFANRAEDAVTWLLLRMVDATIAGRFTPKASSKSDRSKLFQELAKGADLVFRPHEQPDLTRLGEHR